MKSLLYFATLSFFIAFQSYGQLTVFKDKTGQILTTFDVYGQGTISATAYKQGTYLGSPFLTFPVWQRGSFWLDQSGKEMVGELAYNLVSNEVLCRLDGDSAVKIITPYQFTMDGTTFIRQRNKLLGIDYRLYATVIFDTKTQLLVSLAKRIDPYMPLANGYNISKEMSLIGEYKLLRNYYIRKGDAKPEFINLTRSSVLKILYEQADKLAARLPKERLTPADVATTLVYYDSLMANDRLSSPPLLQPNAFNHFLQQQITYPTYAKSQGVYGRVYAEFTVDAEGKIEHPAILSPTNGGFRFDIMVLEALKKMPAVNPIHQGKYVLPVAFTYTNTKIADEPNVPVNRLAEDRLAGKILLDELVVNTIATRPAVSPREVWGYYK